VAAETCAVVRCENKNTCLQQNTVFTFVQVGIKDRMTAQRETGRQIQIEKDRDRHRMRQGQPNRSRETARDMERNIRKTNRQRPRERDRDRETKWDYDFSYYDNMRNNRTNGAKNFLFYNFCLLHTKMFPFSLLC